MVRPPIPGPDGISPGGPPPAPDPVDLRILETLLEEKLLLLELLEAVQALTTAILSRLTRT